MTTQSQGGAPGWRELRRHRLAQQAKERAARQQLRARDEEEEDEEEERPKTKKRAKAARSGKVPSARTSTHLMSKGGVIGTTIFFLRAIAILLIVASTFGNYVQFVGGWESYTPLNQTVVGLAVFYQLLCSIFQWGFKAMRWWPLYALALLASAVPSFLTYNAWVGAYLAPRIGAGFAMAAIALATLAADALPEWVLVE